MAAADSTTVSAVDPTAVVGRRCVQFALDRLLIIVPLVVLGALVSLTLAPSRLSALVVFVTVLLGVLFVLAFVGSLVVDVWWPYQHGGQTPAMRWLGLRIVARDGTTPPLPTLFLRMILLVVDGFLWGLVGLVVMLSSERHQRLGDLVASTTVIRAR
jgi:uncharacterized RDD family membrane protein YckC